MGLSIILILILNIACNVYFNIEIGLTYWFGQRFRPHEINACDATDRRAGSAWLMSIAFYGQLYEKKAVIICQLH